MMIPHFQKQEKGGEDAIYISDDQRLFVVADGVGGWGLQGVDPSLYSRRLIASIKYSYKEQQIFDLLGLICTAEAYAGQVKGSSTLVIGKIEGDVLMTGNLGDSGFVIFNRDLQLIERSTDLSHAFNFPYQIGTNGDGLDPTLFQEYQLKGGDIVVFGSDGLFDNLFIEEMVLILRSMSLPSPPSFNVAQVLAEKAEQFSLRFDKMTPFQKDAEVAQNGHIGGKPDDISVIVIEVL